MTRPRYNGQLYMIVVIRAAVCYWIYEQQRDTRYRLTVEVVSSLDPVICQGVVLRSVFERYTPECRAVSQCATSLKFQSCAFFSISGVSNTSVGAGVGWLSYCSNLCQDVC